MKITPSYNETSNSIMGGFDAKLLSLLKEFGGSTLPLQKIGLNNDMTVALEVLFAGSNKDDIKSESTSISISLKGMPESLLSNILRSLSGLKIELSSNTVKLILLDAQQNELKSPNSPLMFSSALYQKNGQLILSNFAPSLTQTSSDSQAFLNIPPTKSQSGSDVVNTNLSKLEINAQTNLSATDVKENSHQKLKQLIDSYFRAQTEPPIKTSESLRELTRHLNALLATMLPATVRAHLPAMSEMQQKQLVQLLIQLSPSNNPEISLLKQLVESEQQIQQVMKPSDKSQSVSIRHRIETSGALMESRIKTLMRKNSDNQFQPESKLSKEHPTNLSGLKSESSENKANATNSVQTNPLTQFTKETSLFTSESNPDLKFASMQTKESVIRLMLGLETTSKISTSSWEMLKPILVSMLEQLILRTQSTPEITKAQLASETINSLLLSIHQSNSQGQTDSFSKQSLANLQRLLGPILIHFANLKPSPSETLNWVRTWRPLELGSSEQLKLLGSIQTSAENLIHRLEHNQLVSMRAETQGHFQHLLELPIYHMGQIDSFELLFEKQGNQEPQKPHKQWKITIRFELPPMSPIFARVSLKSERISTHFYAKDSVTAELIQTHLDRLKESLTQVGVLVEQLSGNKGVVPDEIIARPHEGIDLKI